VQKTAVQKGNYNFFSQNRFPGAKL